MAGASGRKQPCLYRQLTSCRTLDGVRPPVRPFGSWLANDRKRGLRFTKFRESHRDDNGRTPAGPGDKTRERARGLVLTNDASNLSRTTLELQSKGGGTKGSGRGTLGITNVREQADVQSCRNNTFSLGVRERETVERNARFSTQPRGSLSLNWSAVLRLFPSRIL